MNVKRKDKAWLTVSIISFAIFASSFTVMSFDLGNVSNQVSPVSIVAGAMFWVSLISIIITQIVLANLRKKWFTKNKIRKAKKEQLPGIMCFCRNKYALTADIVCLLSLAALIVSMLLTDGAGKICYYFISLFVFSFSMHCVLNGRIFYHITNKDRLIHMAEKGKANLSK